jgi:hypothetical protein
MHFKTFVHNKLRTVRVRAEIEGWKSRTRTGPKWWGYEPLSKKKVFFKKWLRDRSFIDIYDFKRISIPLVRRVYPSLIANSLVGVQPLSAPSSLVYYLRFRYASNHECN